MVRKRIFLKKNLEVEVVGEPLAMSMSEEGGGRSTLQWGPAMGREGEGR